MIRPLALTASFLLAGAVPVLAQSHPHDPPHPPMPHGPGHVRPDSAHHAAMHALHHGTWTGTFRSPAGVFSKLELSAAPDSAGKVNLRWRADRPLEIGAASNFAMEGANLRWTQELSGKPCEVTAILTPIASTVPEAIEGKMDCEDGAARTFTLRKKGE